MGGLAGAGPAAGPGAAAQESFTRGLADAVYRRLRAHAAPAAAPAPNAPTPSAPASVTAAPTAASLTQPVLPPGPVDRR